MQFVKFFLQVGIFFSLIWILAERLHTQIPKDDQFRSQIGAILLLLLFVHTSSIISFVHLLSSLCLAGFPMQKIMGQTRQSMVQGFVADSQYSAVQGHSQLMAQGRINEGMLLYINRDEIDWWSLGSTVQYDLLFPLLSYIYDQV